jgi:hypothetical protein
MDSVDLLSGDLLSMQDSEIASFADRTDLEAFLQVKSHVKDQESQLWGRGGESIGVKLEMASIERDLTIPD